jgi:hypothetical protein
MPYSRHCQPTGPASGRLDDKLREAIEARRGMLDCFVAVAPRNDALRRLRCSD